LSSAVSSLDTYMWCHYCLTNRPTIPNLNQRKICNCKSKLFFSKNELYNNNNSNDDLINGHWNPIYMEDGHLHHSTMTIWTRCNHQRAVRASASSLKITLTNKKVVRFWNICWWWLGGYFGIFADDNSVDIFLKTSAFSTRGGCWIPPKWIPPSDATSAPLKHLMIIQSPPSLLCVRVLR